MSEEIGGHVETRTESDMTLAVSGAPRVGSLQWDRELLVLAFTEALELTEDRAARRIYRMDLWRMGVDTTALIMVALLLRMLFTYLSHGY